MIFNSFKFSFSSASSLETILLIYLGGLWSNLQLLPYLQNPLSLKYLQSLGCLLLHFLLSHSSRRQISSKWIFLQLASHLQNPNLLNIQTSPVIFDFIFLVKVKMLDKFLLDVATSCLILISSNMSDV